MAKTVMKIMPVGNYQWPRLRGRSCLLETDNGQGCEEDQACWRLTMDKAVRKVMIVGDSEDCEEGHDCWRLPRL